jgi:2-polyprenyl-6-methoxyphenol hydroxylase-like FAD-dependent oxidoreductase
MSEIKPVLIVGAGPTGMTAAMEFSRFSVPVRIVDKLLTPSTTSRALAICLDAWLMMSMLVIASPSIMA